jgi:hypothetical protein
VEDRPIAFANYCRRPALLVDPVRHRQARMLKGSPAGETVVGEDIKPIVEREGFVRIAESTHRGFHRMNSSECGWGGLFTIAQKLGPLPSAPLASVTPKEPAPGDSFAEPMDGSSVDANKRRRFTSGARTHNDHDGPTGGMMQAQGFALARRKVA